MSERLTIYDVAVSGDEPTANGRGAGQHANTVDSFSESESAWRLSTDGRAQAPATVVVLTTSDKVPWRHALCECGAPCGMCVESCCCQACQVSRQYNMLYGDGPNIHWPICFLAQCCSCGLPRGWLVNALAVSIRLAVRSKYHIDGSCCGDCCASFCCISNVLRQLMQEMLERGDFAGATCYTPESQPTELDMV